MSYRITSIVGLTAKILRVHTTGCCRDRTTHRWPHKGIETSPPANKKPQVLHTHDQHATDYVRIMMEAGMNLPMGEDRVVPLITEI